MLKPTSRNLWIDYLRSCITVLVVAHHSSLAYTTFAYFDTTTYINSTSPVVDNSRWIGMDFFVSFNDVFFMPLMFFISGLFLFRSKNKKGTKKFLYDRFKRLGIPFIVGIAFIIPIAYLPSFYLINHHFNIPLFIKDYISNQKWPVGPPWFIWILLLFNIVASLLPSIFFIKIFNATARLIQKPFLFLL